ncbi:hypothetical protein MPSEU_000639500 [Mayamaea pseudoterrestris]|nr:hypothetical protein MPSEU_000639500 [Mayamaea pseudoterrestris]
MDGFDWMNDCSDGDDQGNDADADDKSQSSSSSSSSITSSSHPRPSLSQCTREDDSDIFLLAPAVIPEQPEISSDEVLRRIEDFAASFIDQLDNSHSFPMLQSYNDPAATTDNDDDMPAMKQISKRFTALHQSRSYTSIWLVLSFCHSLLRSNRTATNREVYYHYVTHFRKQRECDAAILDVALLLQVPRMALGLKASPKGWYCGCVLLISDNVHDSKDGSDKENVGERKEENILCDGRKLSSPNGFPVTSEWLMGKHRRNFTIRSTNECICILVIEKEGVYNRLAEDRFFDNYPCVLVCGKGFPDLATRACVYTLSNELDLPVWGVADCDPYGILVLHCYMYGNNAQLGVDGGSRYGVPIQWVGLRPSQVPHIATDKNELPSQCLMELTDKDRKVVESILAREDHRWTNFGDNDRRVAEMETMLEDGYKVELEAFNWIGMDYFSEWLGKIFEHYLQVNKPNSDAGDSEIDVEQLGWMEII